MSLLTLLQSGGAVVITGNGIVYYRQFWELDMQFLRQSTASQEVLLGPFVSDTDFKTPQTGLTILNTDILLWKSGATSEVTKNSGGATHISSGRYYTVLDATDTNTVGMLEINVVESGALPVKSKYYVLTQSVYDSLFSSASTGPLKPTVDNRTLDITATGAAGIDWGNVENQSAMVSLSNTNIQLCTDVDNVGFVNILNAGAITSSSINPGALNGKGDWNIGKTGYALSSTGLNLITAWTVNLTGNVSGSVGSVTSPVTVGTNNDKTGYSLIQAFPANFSSFSIDVNGKVLLQPTQTGVTIPYVTFVEELGTNALSANDAVNDVGPAVWNVLTSISWPNGSFGERVLIGNTTARTVAVTGAHHVAADIHEFQPGAITAADFAAGAIDANALAADAATEVANAVAATQALSRLDSMIESDGSGQFRFDTIALGNAPAGGGGGTVNIVVEDRSITLE